MPIEIIDTLKQKNGGSFPVADACDIEHSGKRLSEYLDALDAGEYGGGAGTPGRDGITPHIGENGNWYIGDEDTGVKARGEDGAPGAPGTPGTGTGTGAGFDFVDDVSEMVDTAKAYVHHNHITQLVQPFPN